jgi:hypothetical protein
VNQSNRIVLEGGKIIQLDRADFGHVLRLLEGNAFITPRLALTAEYFDILMRCAGVVDLGWVRMERFDRALWLVKDGKLWAEVSWAKVWRLAQAIS